MPVKQRRKLVDSRDDRLSLSGQCLLLNLHRSVYYYKPKGISAEDLHIMQVMDRMYIEDPTRGVDRGGSAGIWR
jgi:putative transposase